MLSPWNLVCITLNNTSQIRLGIFQVLNSLVAGDHKRALKFSFIESIYILRARFNCFVHARLLKSLQSCSTLCDPMDCSLPRSSVHGTLQARILEWVVMPSSKGSSQPTDWTQVANIVGRVFTSLPSELPGKPKNTGVGSLSLLQGIFLTQESNSDLLHQR